VTTLTGKTAIITGASRGIGRAVAERLGRDGAAIVVAYATREAAAAETVNAIVSAGGRATASKADVSRLAEVRLLFDETKRFFGPPDILVAVAGSMLIKPFAETVEEDYDIGLSVNARGTFMVFSEASRRISDGGRIIGFSSSLVAQGRAGIGLYVAGKAAIEQYVKVLAKELGPRQITVNAVAPGPTDTELLSERGRTTAPQMTPLGRIAQPFEIADVVAFLASQQGGWVNGQVIGVNGGIV